MLTRQIEAVITFGQLAMVMYQKSVLGLFLLEDSFCQDTVKCYYIIGNMQGRRRPRENIQKVNVCEL